MLGVNITFLLIIQLVFGKSYAGIVPEVHKKTIRSPAGRGLPDSTASDCYDLGVLYQKKGEIKTAVGYLIKASELFLRQKDQQKLARCYSRLGLLYAQQGLPGQGLRYLIKGLHLAGQYTNISCRIRLNILLAAHYNNYTNQYATALRYLRTAEKLNRKYPQDQKDLRAYLCMEYSNFYLGRKQYSTALHYNDESLKLCYELGDAVKIARSYIGRASVYLAMKRPDRVFYTLKEAERFISDKTNPAISASAGRIAAEAYTLQKAYGSALSAALHTSAIMEKNGQGQDLQNLRPLLFKLLYLKGEIKKADSTCSAYAAAQNKIYSRMAALVDAEVRNRYETEKKDRQIRLQNLQISHQRYQNYSLAILLILLFVISLVSYIRFLERKKNALVLEQKNREIEKQVAMLHTVNQQKEMLIRETHHRVKNNLQVISSLFNLQARQTTQPEVLKALNESKSRLKSISLIHHQLYSDSALNKIDLRHYIRQLTTYLKDIYKTESKEITISIATGNLSVNADTAVPLGLILTELITNSLKHAFHGKRPGWISISASGSQNNEYLLEFRDNGCGLPGGLLSCDSKTLGLRLVDSLSRQLSGSFHYSPRPFPTFYIRFKENP